MFANTPLTRCPLIFDTLTTLLIYVVSAGLGRLLLRRLNLTISDALERGLFAVTLGLGALTFVPFVLFALGIGQPRLLVATLVLIFILLLPEWTAVLRGAWRGCVSSLQAWRRAPIWLVVFIAALAPLLALTFLQALCPPTDPDGLHYHLTAPLRYLAEGRFHYMPTYLHTNWPLGIEMLFAIGLAFNHYYAAGLIQFGIGVLLLLATVALGKRLVSWQAGWLAVGLVYGLIEGEMAWAYIDLGLALFTVMSFYAFLIGWQTRESVSPPRPLRERGPGGEGSPGVRASLPLAGGLGHWWTLAALLAGFSATTKLPGIINVGLLALMAFWTLYKQSRSSGRFAEAFVPAIKLSAVGALVALPWYLRCWAQTGDPFYPYLASLFHARDWDAAAQQRMTHYFQVFNTLRARNLTPKQVFEVRAVTAVIVAVAGVAMSLWRGTRTIRPLVVFLFASICIQVVTSGIYIRFFLPIVPLACLLVFWFLRQILAFLRRFLSARQAQALSTALQGAIALLVIVRLWGLAHPAAAVRGKIALARETLPVALGTTSRDAYLLKKIPAYPALRLMNETLPKNATVVMGLWEGDGALLERRSLVTSPWTQNALRLDSFAHLVADLQRLHADYLLLHPASFGNATLASVGQEDRLRLQMEFPKLSQLEQTYAEKLFDAQGYELFALRLPATEGKRPQQQTTQRPPAAHGAAE